MTEPWQVLLVVGIVGGVVAGILVSALVLWLLTRQEQQSAQPELQGQKGELT